MVDGNRRSIASLVLALVAGWVPLLPAEAG